VITVVVDDVLRSLIQQLEWEDLTLLERLSSPALRDDGALEWEDLTLLELAISLCTPRLGFQPHEIGEEEGDTETERVLCL